MKERLVLKSSLKPAVVLQLDVTSATMEFLGVSSLLDTWILLISLIVSDQVKSQSRLDSWRAPNLLWH